MGGVEAAAVVQGEPGDHLGVTPSANVGSGMEVGIGRQHAGRRTKRLAAEHGHRGFRHLTGGLVEPPL